MYLRFANQHFPLQMTSETFSYNQDEAAQIISQSIGTRDILQTPASELRACDYERELRKFSMSTMIHYPNTKGPPQPSTQPTMFSVDLEYCLKFRNILNKCSFDIILLTIGTLQKKLSESQEKICSIEQQISSTIPTEEWTSIKTRLDKTMKEFRTTTDNNKRKKFKRDADDYLNDRVYRWQDQSTAYN